MCNYLLRWALYIFTKILNSTKIESNWSICPAVGKLFYVRERKAANEPAADGCGYHGIWVLDTNSAIKLNADIGHFIVTYI